MAAETKTEKLGEGSTQVDEKKKVSQYHVEPHTIDKYQTEFIKMAQFDEITIQEVWRNDDGGMLGLVNHLKSKLKNPLNKNPIYFVQCLDPSNKSKFFSYYSLIFPYDEDVGKTHYFFLCVQSETSILSFMDIWGEKLLKEKESLWIQSDRNAIKFYFSLSTLDRRKLVQWYNNRVAYLESL